MHARKKVEEGRQHFFINPSSSSLSLQILCLTACTLVNKDPLN